jgi:caa(3)-type oxidase subunit IV
MSGHSAEAVKKQIRGYYLVFAALAVLTVVTVGVSYLELSMPQAVAVALLVATVKASLVAAIFMHLRAEKKIIWVVLAFAAAFFIVLLLYPSWHAL